MRQEKWLRDSNSSVEKPKPAEMIQKKKKKNARRESKSSHWILIDFGVSMMIYLAKRGVISLSLIANPYRLGYTVTHIFDILIFMQK